MTGKRSYAAYRRSALPGQLDRARRRYLALLGEARREGRTELLTDEERAGGQA